MCELFAMSSRIATTVSLSIDQLARRGNQSGRLGDGWGVGFYDENDARVFREPEPADESAWVRFLAERPMRSQIVLSHLRHATQGDISLRNTQPFARELGGRIHLFIHNGNLKNIEQRLAGSGAATGRSDRQTPRWPSVSCSNGWRRYGRRRRPLQQTGLRWLPDLPRNCARLARPTSSIPTASCCLPTVTGEFSPIAAPRHRDLPCSIATAWWIAMRWHRLACGWTTRRCYAAGQRPSDDRSMAAVARRRNRGRSQRRNRRDRIAARPRSLLGHAFGVRSIKTWKRLRWHSTRYGYVTRSPRANNRRAARA